MLPVIEASIEQLERISLVTAKNMFGGVGLYAEGYFFALIADDQLYFKVDDSNRSDFEAAAMTAVPATRYAPSSARGHCIVARLKCLIFEAGEEDCVRPRPLLSLHGVVFVEP